MPVSYSVTVIDNVIELGRRMQGVKESGYTRKMSFLMSGSDSNGLKQFGLHLMCFSNSNIIWAVV